MLSLWTYPLRAASMSHIAFEQLGSLLLPQETNTISKQEPLCSEAEKPDLLRNRGIYIEDRESEASNGKLAMVFTGQGSQSLDMMVSLASKIPVVMDTFNEADHVLKDELGASLWSFIQSKPEHTEQERQAQIDILTDTRIAQPVTLTIDIALFRALSACGIKPDMVAGHSLGEYAAAVAAGVMSFRTLCEPCP